MSVQPIDPMSDRPVYQQIADRLREQIADGVVRAGDRLPSESDLMEQFGSSRATVRRALGVLANEGRVVAERGVGVFVRGEPEEPLYWRRPRRFEREYRGGEAPTKAEAHAQGLAYRQHVDVDDVPAPPDVAERLGLDAGATVLVRRRLIEMRPRDAAPVDNARVELADSYFPPAVADAVPALRARSTGMGGTHARIEEQGFRLTHFDERVVFRMPTPREARDLRLAPGVPVIDLTRVAVSDTGPVECFRAVMAGDRCGLEYEIALDETAPDR